MRYLVFFSLIILLIMVVIKAVAIYPLIVGLGIDWFFKGALLVLVTVLYAFLFSVAWGFLKGFSQFINLF